VRLAKATAQSKHFQFKCLALRIVITRSSFLGLKEGFMTSNTLRLSLLAASIIAVAACNKGAASNNTVTSVTTTTTGNSAAATDPTASAESAAPASIAHDASIATVDSKGAMTMVRKGSGEWTCMPDNPVTPGTDPMCFDANAAKWVNAWVHHQTPPEGVVGVIYMLEGGTDASNTDPYATKPTADNDWVNTGPHIMVVGSKDILAGHPAGAKPDTSAPYVMWAGTPYAHLMIPVAAPK